jgi:predicted metal-dependent phosphoesterase TrpH
MAAQRGLAAIAITDHDTIDGVAEAVEEGERVGIEIVPGVEISVSAEVPPGSGREQAVHLLVYYVRKQKLSLAMAIKMAREEGAVPVLAHPRGRSKGLDLEAEGEDDLRGLLVEWKEIGLLGVEIEYPDHDAGDRKTLGQIAREVGLVATGGSDFHGSDTKGGIELGSGRGGNVEVPVGVLREVERVAGLGVGLS